MELPTIRTGQFAGGNVADYRFERLGEVFVERVIWAQDTPLRRIGGTVIAGPGYLCFRFWLPAYDQIVERYFSDDGVAAGTLLDVCTPLVCQLDSCSTTDLLLDLWIDPRGQVTLYKEAQFEEAVRSGLLESEQADLAERHVRELTAALARGRFPPPLVRNWRVDPARIRGGGAAG